MKARKKLNNRILAVMICVTAMLCLSLFSTLAYLTDTSAITNVFTLGKVDIEMDETLVDQEGNPVDKNGDPIPDGADVVRTEEGNTYRLIPGAEYLKDPIVTVKAGSEKSYVRTILTVTNYDVLKLVMDKHGINDFAAMIDWDQNNSDWEYIGYHIDNTKDTISFEFRYRDKVNHKDYVDAFKSDKDIKLQPLFEKLVVPGEFTAEDIAKLQKDENKTEDDIKVIVEAHAIQVVGFEDETDAAGKVTMTAEDLAWAAFGTQETDAAKGASIKK